MNKTLYALKYQSEPSEKHDVMFFTELQEAEDTIKDWDESGISTDNDYILTIHFDSTDNLVANLNSILNT